jgi:hypothetical protein
MEGWEPYAVEAGRLLLGMIPAENPSVAAILVANAGLSNDSPMVTINPGDETRLAVYLPQHAIQEGRPVVVTRMTPAPDSGWIVEITNYQCGPFVPGGSGAPILFGEPATGAGADDDWTEGDGGMLPMPIGEEPV